jgi:hypothetical protein
MARSISSLLPRTLRGLKAKLSELNEAPEFFEPRVRVCPGQTAPERETNARAQIVSLQTSLEKLACHLEKASEELPRGTTRIRTQKSEAI